MDYGHDRAQQALLDVVLDGASVREFLTDLCAIAVEETARGAHCGFTLDRGGRALTVAGTDGLAAQLEELERRYGDGPGAEAVRSRACVEVRDVAHDGRWPELAAEALALGVASGAWFPLVVDGRPVGVMSLTSSRRHAFGAAEVQRGQWIADQAGAGLRLALDRTALLVPEDPPSSILTPHVVDQAVGVLMHARQISAADAVVALRQLAREAQVPATDMAARIIADGTVDPHRPTT